MRRAITLSVALLISLAGAAALQAQDQDKSWLNVYGFAMLDTGYNANQIDPNWFDVVRPTKLPAFKDQFGPDGNWYSSVRQTRFGVKTGTPTELGELFTQFEFELFGTGVDAGQTTFRLRHAYAELGQFGAGQTWSPFMDIDVFPNSLEYWGPNGMVFFRNVQVRWMPIKGDTRLTFALERPGASADQGDYAGRVELEGVKAHFPYPDLSGQYRYGQKWGYVQAAGIVREMKWKDMNNDALNLSGSATGWGINLTSNIKFHNDADTLRLAYNYGQGIENYMNDAPVDVGIEKNPGNAVTPIKGKALPSTGIVAFLDHNWNPKFSSAIGYSSLDIKNSDGQTPDAFHKGEYALANLLWTPVKNFMVGWEVQWGKRHNFQDGFTSDIFKVQFSAKANFSKMFGG